MHNSTLSYTTANIKVQAGVAGCVGWGRSLAAGVFNKSAPTPQGVTGRVEGFQVQVLQVLQVQVFKASGGPPLPPAPTQKFIKSSSKIESEN